jgi:hypothetical protein
MSDGHFGISLHLWDFMPKCVCADSILVEIEDKDGDILKSQILLPHQLYLKDLMEISREGEYNVFVTPQFPIQKRIPIFEEVEK